MKNLEIIVGKPGPKRSHMLTKELSTESPESWLIDPAGDLYWAKDFTGIYAGPKDLHMVGPTLMDRALMPTTAGMNYGFRLIAIDAASILFADRHVDRLPALIKMIARASGQCGSDLRVEFVLAVERATYDSLGGIEESAWLLKNAKVTEVPS
jgi:hypothetical protein